MTTILEGLEDFTEFIDFSVEEKKWQLGVYTGTMRERAYYRPLKPDKLLEGIGDDSTTVAAARIGRMAYDMIRARQRANALFERRREDYYMLATRNAESDMYFLEGVHTNYIRSIKNPGGG